MVTNKWHGGRRRGIPGDELVAQVARVLITITARHCLGSNVVYNGGYGGINEWSTNTTRTMVTTHNKFIK